MSFERCSYSDKVSNSGYEIEAGVAKQPMGLHRLL